MLPWRSYHPERRLSKTSRGSDNVNFMQVLPSPRSAPRLGWSRSARCPPDNLMHWPVPNWAVVDPTCLLQTHICWSNDLNTANSKTTVPNDLSMEPQNPWPDDVGLKSPPSSQFKPIPWLPTYVTVFWEYFKLENPIIILILRVLQDEKHQRSPRKKFRWPTRHILMLPWWSYHPEGRLYLG